MFTKTYFSTKFNLIIRSFLLLSLVLGLLASTGFSADAARLLALDYTPAGKLNMTPAAANAQFGYSVAVSGDTAVVGAPGVSNGAGAAYVYQYKDSAWTYIKTLLPSTSGNKYLFGGSVAIDGDTIAVGAKDDSSLNPTMKNTGAVYVFSRDYNGVADSWGESQKVTLNPFRRNDRFGASVAIKGNLMVVGAPYDDTELRNAGTAYVFKRASETSPFGAPITLTGYKNNDKFGQSVATDGTSIVVGTTLADAKVDGLQIANSGAAYVFSPNPTRTAWLLKKTLYGGPVQGENFGQAVSVSGDFVVVGAPYSTALLPGQPGAAYLFSRNQGGEDKWGLVKKFTGTPGSLNNLFGTSVWVDASIVAVGAPNEDVLAVGGGTNVDQGATYVFVRNEGGFNAWNQAGIVTSETGQAGDLYGNAVAVVGNTLIVGASMKTIDITRPLEGEAYIYNTAFPLVIDLNGDGGAGTGLELTFTEGDAPLAISNPELAISYDRAATLVKATVQIPFVYDPGSEFLAAVPSGSIDQAEITYNPTTGLLEIAPAAPAPIAEFEAVLRTVTYHNTSENPNPNVRAIEYSIFAADASSNPSVTLVNMAAQNDAPSITTPAAQVINEDSSLAFTGGAIQVSDVDAGDYDVEVSLAVNHGTLTLGQTTGLTFTGTNGSAAFTFTGKLVDVNTALNSLVYMPTANYYNNGVNLETLTINVSDLGATGQGNILTDSKVVNITVNSVKDASTITFVVKSTSGSLEAFKPVTVDYSVISLAGIPTGGSNAVTVSVVVDGKTVSCTGGLDAQGKGSCTMIIPKTGPVPFTASYMGDADFLPSSSTLDFTMERVKLMLPLLTRN